MGSIKIAEINFIDGSNFQRSKTFSSALSLNVYPFYDSVTKRWVLYSYAGSNKILDFEVSDDTFTGRPGGSIATEQKSFHIIGNTLFEIDLSFNVNEITTIGTSEGPVSMALGGKYLVVVDGSTKLAYDIQAGTFSNIVSESPLNPNYVSEIQSFFLMNDSGSQLLQQSAPYDPTVWNAINSIEINYRSSFLSYPLLAMPSINGRIFCMTSGFIQVLENSGKVGFSFRPDLNLVFGYGAVNATCVAIGVGGSAGKQLPEFIIFISTNSDGSNKVMMTTGASPEVISNESIDYRLDNLLNIKDATAYCWTENGQTFYVCSFNQDNLTIVYNINTKKWFDISYKNGRHFGESFCYFGQKKLVTSCFDAGLYELSENFITDDGLPKNFQKVTETFYETSAQGGYQLMQGNLLFVYFQTGVGLVGQKIASQPHYVYGSFPQVYLEISFDGGVTFGPPQIGILGSDADRQVFCRFENLGTGRFWTFRLTVSDPVIFCLIGSRFWYQVNEGSK